MPEAVIVSAARSPIGRANKGSLKDLRPDDLTATIIKTALDKVEGLDPNTVDDVYRGIRSIDSSGCLEVSANRVTRA